ncbi:hypothetical protein ACKVMT_09025 [Halobacteriales archaeon Cl-PHB]
MSAARSTDHAAARRGLSRPRLCALVGSGLTAVGAFLPWVGVGTHTITGVQTQGGVTLAVATLAAVTVLLFWSRRGQVAVAAAGTLVAAIGLLAIDDPTGGLDLSLWGVDVGVATVSPEVGLYLTTVGGLCLLGGAVWALGR